MEWLDFSNIAFFTFHDKLIIVRRILSGMYEKEQNWNDAANVLAGIQLESGQK